MRAWTLLAGAAVGAGVIVSCAGATHYLGCNDEGVPIYISGVCPEYWTIVGPCAIEPTDTDSCYYNGHSMMLTMAPIKSAGGNATCTITLFWDGQPGFSETVTFDDCRASPSPISVDVTDAGTDAPPGWNVD